MAKKLVVLIGIAGLIFIFVLLQRKVNYQYYTVTKVIDGDTIELSNGMEVRFLGIDAPEIVHNNIKEECGGQAALQYNTQLLMNKKVRLERETEEKDIYGRLLRNVFTEDNRFVNYEMVRNGWAQVLIIYPDHKYENMLENAQQSAIASKKGLWNLCKPFNERKLSSLSDINKCVFVRDVKYYIGDKRCVVYTISSVFRSTENMHVLFLKNDPAQDGVFNAVIFPSVLDIFQSRYGDIDKKLIGKTVKVYGQIQLYRGNPEVIVNELNQLSILE